ncbi:hypothetical protein EV175_005157, partial [Coemansia sp. RSA 1933]
DDHRPSHRHAAWDMYWQHHSEQALRKWGTASPYAQGDMVPFVMLVLQRHGVEYMRAPYASWAQLAYLYKHETQPIHAIYSSLDVLMFDVDRVITTISPTKQTFGWIQRDHIVSRCGVASDQILDMCILAGFDWCPTFPALLSDIGFSFKSAVDITRQYRSGFNAIQMMGDHAGIRSSNYCDSFMRAYCIVKYHIVMHLDGSVGPLNPDYAPNDIHDIIGYRLPTRAYHLLARGLVHPPVLNMLVSGSWLEFSPADNGESAQYQRLVTQWEGAIYKQLCAPLCASLGPFFQQRKVSMCAWFDPHAEILLHETASGKTQTRSQPLAAKAAGSPRTAVSLAQILQRSSELIAASSTTSGSDEELALAVLASLGFVTRSGKHTQLGAALLKGLLALGQGSDAAELGWTTAVATILFAQGLLTGDKWTVAYEDERPAAAGDERQQTFVRLVSRIATLVPLCGRKSQWRLAYNRDLLAFSSAAKVVLKAAASSLDSARLERIAAISDAGPAVSSKLQIPLECATNNGSGLLVHALLTDFVRGGGGCWKRVCAEAGDSIGDPKQTLGETWRLVEAVVAMAQEYRKESSGKTKPSPPSMQSAAADSVKRARDWARPVFAEALGPALAC